MAIARMENVTLAFPRDRLEDVHMKLISSGAFEPIHMQEIVDPELSEDLSVVGNGNPYQGLYDEMMNFLKMTGYEPLFDERNVDLNEPLDIEDTTEKFRQMNESIHKFFNEKNDLNKRLQTYENVLFHVRLLAGLDVELEDFAQLSRIKLIFGRVPIRNYETLVESSLKVPILILEVSRDKDSSWIFVFTTPDFMDEAHKILQSAYFEEDSLPVEQKGTPYEIKERMEALIEVTRLSIEENDLAIKKVLYANKEFIDRVYPIILAHKRTYDLASFSNSTPGKSLCFLSGWVPEEDAKTLSKEIGEDVLVVNKAAEEMEKKKVDIPVKLKNPGFLFRGYEFITNMFGTPNYNEIDPTPFVTLFFIFMYGFMLGDVGHGLILFLFGYLMYRRNAQKMGTVIMSAAISSIFFGFMYGSVFGFDWIPTVWLKPILQINQLLIISIYFGVGMMTFGMILNIINGFKQRNWEKAIFGAEGIVGLLFYSISLLSISLYLVKGKLPFNRVFLEIIFFVSLLLMLLKGILGQLVSHKKISLPNGFWVEAGFGLFDALIRFFSNTISYVRLAAFALTHEALFLAFWTMTLMVLPAPGGGIWAAIIFLLGQIILVGLEGLVVFIQALRLVYYEFFTKFFEGTGRTFHPFVFKETGE